MAKVTKVNTATDGSKDNDHYVKNDSGCCVYVPLPESPVMEVDTECNSGCNSAPTNPCGMDHPVGSGTLAGCKSTTLPHFGVVMNTRKGTCSKFAYYTSGNTEEYENECGGIDRLSAREIRRKCTVDVKYRAESCDCFDNADANEADEEAMALMADAVMTNTASTKGLANALAANTAADEANAAADAQVAAEVMANSANSKTNAAGVAKNAKDIAAL